ncbi:142_t:CDS:1, partial [Entrophospora sp. SA101]
MLIKEKEKQKVRQFPIIIEKAIIMNQQVNLENKAQELGVEVQAHLDFIKRVGELNKEGSFDSI